MSDKSIIAAKKENISDTYVLVQNLSATVKKLVANDPASSEVRVLGFQLTEEDAQAIAYALTETKILKALSLDHLHIGDSGAKHIAQGLCYNQSVTYLSLRWNDIGSEGAKAIAEALYHNKSIKTLEASFNNFGRGGEHFTGAIKENKTLEMLSLKWNSIQDDVGDSLLEAMGENKGCFSTLLLGGNGSSLRNARKGVAKSKMSQSARSKSKRFLTLKKTGKAEVDTTVSLDQLRKDLATIEDSDEEEAVEEPHEFEVGDRVECRSEGGNPKRIGHIRFIGGTEFQREGIWIGVEFSSPSGKNNGTVAGVQYFSCPPNHGSFLRADKLTFLE